MPWHERASIIQALGCVDEVIAFDDSDGSACAAIEHALKVCNNPNSWYPFEGVVFANGGDRTKDNIPEMKFEEVEFAFGVGGEDKANSSSWILEEWKAPKTERQWGYYRVLHEVPGMKVKELTVNPGESLSMQRHNKRSEYWIVSEGRAMVNTQTNSGYHLPSLVLDPHQETHIPVEGWHQLTNPFKEPLRVVEIQYGADCDEDDIERQ
jgi:mannose-6-phosphate isomerase-like protein (cupin superfamily)